MNFHFEHIFSHLYLILKCLNDSVFNKIIIIIMTLVKEDNKNKIRPHKICKLYHALNLLRNIRTVDV